MIGHPIDHSVSPQMHNAALAAHVNADPRLEGWRYVAFDIEPDALPAALNLMHRHGFLGVNLTVPHKVMAVELVSAIDPAAAEAGAVNTLVREGPGWRGYNTDGYGLAAGLREDLGVDLRGSSVVLLGAGGAARGAAVECLRAGCVDLRIINRSPDRLDELMAAIRPLAGSIAVGTSLTEPRKPASPILINATSAGLKSGDAPPIDLSGIEGLRAVYDMIYNPPRTVLLAQAAALGIRHANGLGMLVHQGAKALEIWTGIPAPRLAPAMRAAASKALGY